MAYTRPIDLACRTLFLARMAPLAIFLSQIDLNRLPCIVPGKHFVMTI